MQVGLNARKDIKSRFHYCESLVDLVYKYFSIRKDLENNFTAVEVL